jgi:hypothetical protein
MRKSGIAVAIVAVMLIQAGTAQQPPKPKPRSAMDCLPDPVRHVPYSAEFSMTNTYPGSDGKPVVYNYSDTEAFDSHGRYLGTSTFPDPNHKGPPQTTGLECDRTTDTQYQWDSLKRSLVVLKMPKMEERQGCWESDAGDFFVNFDKARRVNAETRARMNRINQASQDQDPSNPLVEDLGTMTLQGVEVRGTRTTHPPAASSSEGEPDYLVEEHWASPLLGFWLQQEVDYARSPKHNSKWTRRVTNLRLGDPDPSTFDPPSGYIVFTETMHQVACEVRSVSSGGPSSHLH